MTAPISTLDLENMQRRLSLSTDDKPVNRRLAGGVKREMELHDAISKYCKSQGWLYLRSNPTMPTGRMPGEPDFLILADGGRVFFLEAKAAAGKLSKDQVAFHRWAVKLGHTIHIVKSMADVLCIVDALGSKTQQTSDQPRDSIDSEW